LLLAIIATFVLAGMAGAMLAISSSRGRLHTTQAGSMKAFYAAEAGLNDAIVTLKAGGVPSLSMIAPTSFAGGEFSGSVVDNGDGTTTITSIGVFNNEARAVQAVLQKSVTTIYDCALFAGNTSGDAGYALELGGYGAQADQVTGNVFSGGNVALNGDATIAGTAYASGTVAGSGASATKTGVSQPVPDIAGMNYASNNDFDVAAEFSGAEAAYQWNALGGEAWQLPATNPCHIFRKNPSNRTSETSTTAKDDYFLEDPYEVVVGSSTVAKENGTKITLTGIGGGSGPSSNDKVFYIDGNLWIHNYELFTFTFDSSGSPDLKVTFVVNGNIYISDNIFYDDPANDGIAFIAAKDPAEPDSGNIYFGDPTFGTLEHMEAFMYAENDFHDTNLSASGSAKVTVYGNMTAGNHVDIKRDFGSQHSKLTVLFDDRISIGALDMPGLPGVDEGGSSWVTLVWREIAVP
jgi:hypothetical protein